MVYPGVPSSITSDDMDDDLYMDDHPPVPVPTVLVTDVASQPVVVEEFDDYNAVDCVRPPNAA